MPEYEGVLTQLRPDGRAEVLVQPGRSEIVGAPNLNVCHCPTESASFVIQAANTLGAKAGDRVVVYRSAEGLKKNILYLVGVPVVGLALGVFVGWAVGKGWVQGPLIAGGAGAIVGIVLGAKLYGKSDGREEPRICRITQQARGDAPPLCSTPGGSGRRPSPSICDGCVGQHG